MDAIGALSILHNCGSVAGRRSNPSSKVTAKAEAEDRLQDQLKSGQDGERGRRITPGRCCRRYA
jgi:hypothetical protein